MKMQCMKRMVQLISGSGSYMHTVFLCRLNTVIKKLFLVVMYLLFIFFYRYGHTSVNDASPLERPIVSSRLLGLVSSGSFLSVVMVLY
jgi:hypothetical protein